MIRCSAYILLLLLQCVQFSIHKQRPDYNIVDRLLLFRVNRLEKFRKESEILDEILSNRNNLWSELLDDLNPIVKALKEDKENFVSGFRLADWADLGWRIAKTQGAGDTFIKLLEKMDMAQSEFLLEDNPLFDCLDIWLENTSNRGREVTASQLYNELQIVVKFGLEVRANPLQKSHSFFDNLNHKDTKNTKILKMVYFCEPLWFLG